MQHSTAPLVLVVHTQGDSQSRISAILGEAGFGVQTAGAFKDALEAFYETPPRCVVIEHDIRDEKGRSLVDELKSDNVYGHLPVILIVTSKEIDQDVNWPEVPADEYIVDPFRETELISRVKLCLARAQRDVNANPLTCLPGNLTIRREAERRLEAGQAFAFAYVDLDGFKAFNDRYGFARGDEVLRMTSRVLVNSLRALDEQQTYVGHIGGDDFVFIVPSHLTKGACEAVIRDFDLVVRNFYDEEDRLRGLIQSCDRQGNAQTFPIMSCSIGVVDTSSTTVTHVAGLLDRVSEVKSYAKRLPGGNYIIDRRK